jgi:hypothetical protein
MVWLKMTVGLTGPAVNRSWHAELAKDCIGV